MFPPAEIHPQLLGFSCIELEVILLASIQVLGQFSVRPVISILDEANNGSVIRELLWVAVCGAVCEVCDVKGEQEWCQDRTLGGPCAEHNGVQETLPGHPRAHSPALF